MKRFRGLFGACSVIILVCIAGAFIASFFITQNTADLVLPTGLPVNTNQSVQASNTPAPLPTLVEEASSDGDFVVSITLGAPGAATNTPAVNNVEVVMSTPSATPTTDVGGGGSDLGTMSYPMTATYEAQVQSTKVQSYVNGVDATRTTAAEHAIPTRMAQTATAVAKQN